MKLYLVDDSDSALACAQLIRLGAECAKLQWSRTIPDVPEDVTKALATIQEYAESKTIALCGNKSFFAELDEETEGHLLSLFKKSDVLKRMVGSSVIMAGNQSKVVLKEIKGDKKLEILTDAISSGKSVVLL